jgi:hypothetical protein
MSNTNARSLIIEKRHRQTIRHQDAEHETARLGHECISCSNRTVEVSSPMAAMPIINDGNPGAMDFVGNDQVIKG